MGRIHAVLLLAAVLCTGLLTATPALAETATLQVWHLPLDEAAAAARTQMSASGNIAELPSQHMLIVSDKPENIDRVTALLKKIDIAPVQLSVQLHIDEQSENDASAAHASVLPGGWVRVAGDVQHSFDSNSRDMMLRVSAGAPGHVEAGEIRAIESGQRQYLAAHGIRGDSEVDLLNVTGGFDVLITMLPGDRVRLSIHPWLRNMSQDAGMDARTEMLIDAGSTLSPGSPPSGNPPVRINAQPHAGKGEHPQRIMVAEANTEVELKLDEKVTLVASHSAAGAFSNVLFGTDSFDHRRDLTITVTVTKAGM